MARIIPSDISPLALAGAHSGELDTLALLEAQLCPDYRVRNLSAAGLDQSRILDAATTDGLARRIERDRLRRAQETEKRGLSRMALS